ncbi:Mediator complex, subunit Med24, N-terminal domain-containing protein [Strongyloides ratti]|uniref:Mediator complex, subunit Med24, N-terminal domain-containing protein n=1 Tax=Strongyloides ratti TaxID=34506 RepID=A0A090MYD0_STRRB|nr:Mediator complex, subunit Med24, N-terminal domain-containing protein [Strongyloides ratti]CEF66969.1 Mediator complex, subunit Med24, N-terminal domain-containing protein [Strongyloides ratti]
MPEQDIVIKIFNIVKCAALGKVRNSEFAPIIKNAIENKVLTRKEMHQICGLIIRSLFEEGKYSLKYFKLLESLINLCVISGDIVIGVILKTKFENLDKKNIGNFFLLFRFVDFLVSKKKPPSSKGNDTMKLAEEILSIFNWYVELITWNASESFTNFVVKRLLILLKNRYNCVLLHAVSKKSSECKKLLESRALILENKYPLISTYIRENVLVFKSLLERPYTTGLRLDFEAVSSMITVYATVRTLESARDIAEAIYMISKNLQFTKTKMLYDMFKGILYNLFNNKTTREGNLVFGFAIVKFPQIIKSLLYDLRVLDKMDIVTILGKIVTESKILNIVDFQCKFCFWEILMRELRRQDLINESDMNDAISLRSSEYNKKKDEFDEALLLQPSLNFSLEECINAWESLVKLPFDNLSTVFTGLKNVIKEGGENFNGILMTIWFKEELGNLSRLFSKINYLCQNINDSIDENTKTIRLELFDITLMLLFKLYFHFPDFSIEEFVGLTKEEGENENEENYLFYVWITKIDKSINIPEDPIEVTSDFDWKSIPMTVVDDSPQDVVGQLNQIFTEKENDENKHIRKSVELEDKKVAQDNEEKMESVENVIEEEDIKKNIEEKDEEEIKKETKDDEKMSEGSDIKTDDLKCTEKLDNEEEDIQIRKIVNDLYDDKPFWNEESDFIQVIKLIPKIAFTLCEDLRKKLYEKCNVLDAIWCFRSMPSLVICLVQSLETARNTRARNDVLDAIQLVFKKGKFDDETLYDKWHFVFNILGSKTNDLIKDRGYLPPGADYLISGCRKVLPVLGYKETPNLNLIADAMVYTIKQNFVLPEALYIMDRKINTRGIVLWCDLCFQEISRLETPDELDLATSLLLSISFCRPNECFNQITKHIVDSILNPDTWYIATHQPRRSALARLLVRSMCCMIWVAENKKHKEIYEDQASTIEVDSNMNTLEIVFSRFYKETLSGHLKPTVSFILEFIYEMAVAPQTPELSKLYSFVNRKFIFNLARLDPFSVTIDIYYRIFNFDDNGDNGILQFATLNRFKEIL